MNILITGGTGFLGSLLVDELIRNGHEVTVITRKSSQEIGLKPFKTVAWPTLSEHDHANILAADAVINLAGDSIAEGRWSTKKKAQIERSRIQFTLNLVDILRSSVRLKTFISSSAIGYYGDRKTEVLTEDSPHGEGYLAKVCSDWEKAALSLSSKAVRTVLLRTGVVLDRGSGFLAEMEPLFKNRAGGPVGSGDQLLSWIHVKDWLAAVLHTLNNQKISGPVNLVAPEPITNRSFTSIYAKMLDAQVQLPAPELAVKLALGEKSFIALASQNVRPKVLLDTHFKFAFPYLKEALEDLYEYESQNQMVHEFFSSRTWINQPLERVFEFFSDANNLKVITPPEMQFNIVKMSTSKISNGTLIDYKLKVHGLPIKWRTEILNWQPPHKFTDTQLVGPYTVWHHTHTFESLAGGTLMCDRVHYRLPLGVLGRIFGLPLVRRDVKKIFEFREKTIKGLFSTLMLHKP